MSIRCCVDLRCRIQCRRYSNFSSTGCQIAKYCLCDGRGEDQDCSGTRVIVTFMFIYAFMHMYYIYMFVCVHMCNYVHVICMNKSMFMYIIYVYPLLFLFMTASTYMHSSVFKYVHVSV